jgi:hypothetical protein
VAPLVRYGVQRLAVFGAVLAALWLAGSRGLLLILLAGVCSAALSFLLLRRSRRAAAEALAQARGRPRRERGFRAGIARDAAIEDAAVEASGDPDDAGPGHSARPSPTSTP